MHQGPIETEGTSPVTRSMLPMREREVADVVFSRGEVTVNEICEVLPPLTNSSVRVMLERLERKGILSKRRDGKRNYYSPALAEERMRETVLKRLATEHFDGSLFTAALKIIEMMEIHQPGSAGRIADRYRTPAAVDPSAGEADDYSRPAMNSARQAPRLSVARVRLSGGCPAKPSSKAGSLSPRSLI
jgi:BlaI family transcriptional regulator, penicillinase repressor